MIRIAWSRLILALLGFYPLEKFVCPSVADFTLNSCSLFPSGNHARSHKLKPLTDKTLVANIKKMQANILMIILLIFLLGGFAYAAEAVEQKELVEGKIININEEHSFVIINLGTSRGIVRGSTLDVYQNAKRIAELEVVRVRENVAAAEIIRIEPGTIVRVGDRIILTKEVEEIREEKETKAISIEKEIPSPERLIRTQVDIRADIEIVWFYLIQTLRDYGFIITNSNKVTGLITARRSLQLPLVREIWADIRGNTDYETVLWARAVLKGKGKTSLTFKVESSYKRGGKRQIFSIRRKNKVYQEIGEIIEKIKEQAE